MVVALIDKYGLVPKTAMPETESSSSSRRLNDVLKRTLREYAKQLRDLNSAGLMAKAPALKEKALNVLFRILCIHLGSPPRTFDWQWTDKDGEFHRDGTLTPIEFYNKYTHLNLSDYVCVVNDPRETSIYHQRYTVKFLGNIVEAKPVVYLNVPIAELKELVRSLLINLLSTLRKSEITGEKRKQL